MKKPLWILVTCLVAALCWFSCSTHEGPVAAGTSEQPNALTGVTGRAVNEAGELVSGAKAVLIASQPLQAPFYSVDLITDTSFSNQEGSFSFKSVTPGEYTLLLSLAGPESIVDQIPVVSFRKFTITVTDGGILLPPDTLKQAGSIKGHIALTNNDSEINYAYFKVVVMELGRTISPEAKTGNFFISGLPAGTYTLRIQSNYHDYVIVDTEGIVVQSKSTSNLGDLVIPTRDQHADDPAYVKDTLAVRAILEANSISTSVKSVTWVKNGRISYLNLTKPVYTLPNEIGDLTQLEFLGITGAPGSTGPSLSISERLGDLKALRRLAITGYNADQRDTALSLPGFPASRLTSLEMLEIRQNNLRSMPVWISALNKLTTLDLSDPGMNQILPEIAQLSLLRRLNLRNCSLFLLPTEIIRLDCRVDVEGNSLCNDIPNEVSSWLDSHFESFIELERSEKQNWRFLQNCH